MVLGLSGRVSWICLLLFSSAACFPATKGDYKYPYVATWGSSGGPAPASHPASSPAGNQSPSGVGAHSVGVGSSSPTSFRFRDSSVPHVAAAAPSPSDSDGPLGLPWAVQPVGGADASFYDFSNWMPSQPFPDFRRWPSSEEMPQSESETVPLPPSSYIIQSRNGYQRAREVLSNTRYSPEYPDPPVFPFKAAAAPSQSQPASGAKGGPKGQ